MRLPHEKKEFEMKKLFFLAGLLVSNLAVAKTLEVNDEYNGDEYRDVVTLNEFEFLDFDIDPTEALGKCSTGNLIGEIDLDIFSLAMYDIAKRTQNNTIIYNDGKNSDSLMPFHFKISGDVESDLFSAIHTTSFDITTDNYINVRMDAIPSAYDYEVNFDLLQNLRSRIFLSFKCDGKIVQRVSAGTTRVLTILPSDLVIFQNYEHNRSNEYRLDVFPDNGDSWLGDIFIEIPQQIIRQFDHLEIYDDSYDLIQTISITKNQIKTKINIDQKITNYDHIILRLEKANDNYMQDSDDYLQIFNGSKIDFKVHSFDFYPLGEIPTIMGKPLGNYYIKTGK